MHINFFRPHPLLSPYIDAVWVFTSDDGIQTSDARLVVPNGKFKLIVSSENALTVATDQLTTTYKEGSIAISGLWDKPTVIGSPNGKTQSIGMSISAAGMHQLFNIPLHELTNKVYTLEDLYGATGAFTQELIAGASSIKEKITLIEQYLIKRLTEPTRAGYILRDAIQAVELSRGSKAIQDLAKEMGKTERYMSHIFRQYTGISPKTFGNIVRFQNIYRSWVDTGKATALKEYVAYADQSHFIKEFKRYTGYTPQQYTTVSNKFGSLFYGK